MKDDFWEIRDPTLCLSLKAGGVAHSAIPNRWPVAFMLSAA